MNNEVKILESISSFSIIRFYIYQFLCLALLIYVGRHFKENPILILFIMIVLLFVILMNSKGSIIIYNDKIQIVYKRLFRKMNTIKEYKFNEIASITADLPLTEAKHFFTELLPPTLSFVSIWNTITIKFNNNSNIELKSKIYREQYFEAFKAIKRQCNIDITVLGLKNLNK